MQPLAVTALKTCFLISLALRNKPGFSRNLITCSYSFMSRVSYIKRIYAHPPSTSSTPKNHLIHMLYICLAEKAQRRQKLSSSTMKPISHCLEEERERKERKRKKRKKGRKKRRRRKETETPENRDPRDAPEMKNEIWISTRRGTTSPTMREDL